MNVIGLIPARGGSKGVLRKNIRLLNNKPLIKYTIDAAKNSKLINRIIVSTEDNEIAQVSKKLGAEVPFSRPNKLSKDNVLDLPVIMHALDYFINQERFKPDILVYLRPTMPTRTSLEIDITVNMLIKNNEIDSIRTTRQSPYPPYWIKKIDNKGEINPYASHVIPFEYKRRQDLPETVICDGYVDAAKVTSILKENKFPPGVQHSFYRKNIPYFDIDTIEDWNFCEYYMKNNNK